MVNISNNGFIYINRGDSFTVPLFINKNNESDPIRFYIQNHPNAEIFFGVVEPNQPFEKALIKKRFVPSSPINKYGDLEISFKATDTVNVLPGMYYYAIKSKIDLYEHNINCPLANSDKILVYGWEDEFSSVTYDDLKNKIPHIELNGPVEMILVNSKTNRFNKVYAGYDNSQVLQIYKELDEKGKPAGWIAEISLSELASHLDSRLRSTLVDTIKPFTEFLILD